MIKQQRTQLTNGICFKILTCFWWGEWGNTKTAFIHSVDASWALSAVRASIDTNTVKLYPHFLLWFEQQLCGSRFIKENTQKCPLNVSGSHSWEVGLMWLEILKPNLGFKKIVIIVTSCQTLERPAWGIRTSGGVSELFLLLGLPSAPTTQSSWFSPLLRRVLLLLKTVSLSGSPPLQWSPSLPPLCCLLCAPVVSHFVSLMASLMGGFPWVCVFWLVGYCRFW